MGKCDTCGKKKYGYLCDGCIHDPDAMDKYESMTNADRIRAMSDEELADCIYQDVLGVVCRTKQERNESCSEYMCRDCLLEWLKEPAEVDNG